MNILGESRLGNVSDVRKHLDEGADPDMRDRDDWTPLLLATVYDRIGVVRLLLDRGATIDLRGMDGWTALTHAVHDGIDPIAILLLERGADPNPGIGGSSLLLQSYYRRNTDVTRLLIEKGADVNVRTKGGVTPLMYSSSRGDIDIVRLLLKHGADPYVRDHNGRTAASLSSTEVITTLINSMARSLHTERDRSRGYMHPFYSDIGIIFQS